MILKCLASGSAGNCYLIENEEECLIIEAGVSFMKVKKALDFNVAKIVGILISHCHGDHAKYMTDYEKTGIPVFEPYKIETGQSSIVYNGFTIISFPLIHDVPCCGFFIKHDAIGTLVYISDTGYVKQNFAKKKLDHILIECNYADEYLDYSTANYKHVLTGHMSLETCKKFIQANKTERLKNVCLLHLSSRNSHPVRFREEVQEIVGDEVYVTIAENDMKAMILDSRKEEL